MGDLTVSAGPAYFSVPSLQDSSDLSCVFPGKAHFRPSLSTQAKVTRLENTNFSTDESGSSA